MSTYRHFAILGAGAWGSALAHVLAQSGRRVTLWMRRVDQARRLAESHENPDYLPGIRLDARIVPTADAGALRSANALVLAVPAQHCLGTLAPLLPDLPEVPVLLAAKGIDARTGALLSEQLGEVLAPRPLCILSGPTFAAEVARGKPTALTLAAVDMPLAEALAEAVGSAAFRPYAADDPLGAEIGGAVKNVMAIACGIVEGRELGDNARAALLTRGLAEITRFGVALGARPETFMGLSGLGDLTLTCNAMQSRNFSLGHALGRGDSLSQILARRKAVTEGVYTARALTLRAAAAGVEMPIARAVDQVLHKEAEIGEAIAGLLSRPLRSEA